jgi:hypothetical protein
MYRQLLPLMLNTELPDMSHHGMNLRVGCQNEIRMVTLTTPITLTHLKQARITTLPLQIKCQGHPNRRTMRLDTPMNLDRLKMDGKEALKTSDPKQHHSSRD